MSHITPLQPSDTTTPVPRYCSVLSPPQPDGRGSTYPIATDRRVRPQNVCVYDRHLAPRLVGRPTRRGSRIASIGPSKDGVAMRGANVQEAPPSVLCSLLVVLPRCSIAKDILPAGLYHARVDWISKSPMRRAVRTDWPTGAWAFFGHGTSQKNKQNLQL